MASWLKLESTVSNDADLSVLTSLGCSLEGVRPSWEIWGSKLDDVAVAELWEAEDEVA